MRKYPNCLHCGDDITHQNSRTRYCKEKKCAKKAEYKKSGYEVTCEVCNEKFIAKGKNVRMHIGCINYSKPKNDDVELECKWCNEKFTVSFQQRKRRICCSSSCASSYSNSIMDKDAANKKSSETKKKQFASGEIVPSFLGKTHSKEVKKELSLRAKERFKDPTNNPMYGKNHSEKSKEQMSKTRAEKILSGKYHGWFAKGYHYSNKMKKNFYYKSSWEKQSFVMLDSDDDVVSYEYEPFKISYYYKINEKSYKRYYIPDLLIVYRDGSKKLVEIKPDALLDYKQNKYKFKAAKEHCEQNGMIFEIWNKDKLNELENSL